MTIRWCCKSLVVFLFVPVFLLSAAVLQAGLRITFNEPVNRIYDAETARRAQQEATDVFRIRVEQVNVVSVEEANDVVVMVRAEVEKVARSSRPRAPGDLIFIRYRTQAGTGYEDEADPEILEEGTVLPAFLSYIGADNHYILAAGAFSFSLPEEYTSERKAQSTAVPPPDAKVKRAANPSPAPSVPKHHIIQDDQDWDQPVGE